jgi:hypothetical protein
MIPMGEFHRLRIEDFFPAEKPHSVDTLECALGSGDGKSVEWAYFLHKPRKPKQLSLIAVEQISGPVTVEIADAILFRVGVPLRMGLSTRQVIDALGEPWSLSINDDLQFDTVTHQLGGPDGYYVSVVCARDVGLCGFWVAKWGDVKASMRAR